MYAQVYIQPFLEFTHARKYAWLTLGGPLVVLRSSYTVLHLGSVQCNWAFGGASRAERLSDSNLTCVDWFVPIWSLTLRQNEDEVLTRQCHVLCVLLPDIGPGHIISNRRGPLSRQRWQLYDNNRTYTGIDTRCLSEGYASLSGPQREGCLGVRLPSSLPVLPVKRFLLRGVQARSLPTEELRRPSGERGRATLRGKSLLGGRRGAVQRYMLSSANEGRSLCTGWCNRRERDDFPIGMCANGHCTFRDNRRSEENVSSRQP